MLIKLNYTTNKSPYLIFRVITDIINTSSIDSISALQARATSAGYDSSLLSNLDATNSYIYRTTNLSTTSAHYSGNTYAKSFTCTLEFSVYDSVNTKYYVNFNSDGTSLVTQNVGGSITGGTMSSSQMPVTAPDNVNSYLGTVLTVATNNDSYTWSTMAFPYCFWLYITDSGMVSCLSGGSGPFTTGFPSTYSSSTGFTGAQVVSQYIRADYWNTASNNVIPLIYMTQRSGGGLGRGTYDFSSNYHNTEYTTSSTERQAFKVYQYLTNNGPTTSTSYPFAYNKVVSLTVDERASCEVPLTGSSTTAIGNNLNYQLLLSTTVGHTIPNATLTGTSFGQHNLGWSLSYLYTTIGGSITDRIGIYIFNGDFTAGDEYTANGITYVIWPLWTGSSSRIGISIPKV